MREEDEAEPYSRRLREQYEAEERAYQAALRSYERDVRRRRQSVLLALVSALLGLGASLLAGAEAGRGAGLWPFARSDSPSGDPTSVPGESPTESPTQSPTHSPSADPSTPVNITIVGGDDPPVVVVLEQPASEGSGVAGIITSVSGGIVAVGGTATALIWAIRRPRGGEPPQAPTMPGS